jgi:beta-N-acetylhexosaminidase
MKLQTIFLASGLFFSSFVFGDSLDEKIGQMLIVGFRGLSIDDELSIVKQIKSGHVGGVILYDYDQPTESFIRNIESPEQLKKLCEDLQAVGNQRLFICTDQEGGVINRLKPSYGFPNSYSAETLGKKSPLDTYEASKEFSKTLAEMGINLNLAPVADLNIEPANPSVAKQSRSFGKDPFLVKEHLNAYTLAQKENGVISTLKHFPGLGSASKNTHYDFVDITDTWQKEELIPFELLLPSYNDCIMTGHVFHKSFDPLHPCSLSQNVIQKLLREKLGFKGVVITDDIQMGAIRHFYSFEESIKLAILAGSDLLLLANNELYEEEIALRAHAIIKKLIEKGELTEERIDESLERIHQLKARFSNN